MLAFGIWSVPVAGASSGSGFGPSPDVPQSRCAALKVSTHIAFVGEKIRAKAGPAIPDACGGGKVGWTWAVTGVKECRPDSTDCTFRAAASTGDTWSQVCIDGSSTQGPWTSCDYYGVPPKGDGVIEGYVKDKDGGPVAGVDITAYGEGNGRRGASAETGTDGYYAIEVKAGDYTVIPSGGPSGKSKPSYSPDLDHLHVAKSATAKADFELKAGIELKLEFAKSSVVADGLQVLSGAVTTTEFGKPLGNVAVQLDPLPGTSAATLGLSSPRAAVCSAGNRVWPTGTLTDPDYHPVTVTTDASGHFDFTLTVGTTAGSWKLDAWAYTSDGSLSSDTSNASDTKSVTFESAGSGALGGFVNAFNVLAKSTTALASDSTSASAIIPVLSQITASGGRSGPLAGYAYGLVNAPDGQSLLIFPAGQAPAITKHGDVSTGGDLILDPSEWTGQGLSLTNAASLEYVTQQGLLPDLPTLAQFDAGTSLQGWKAVGGSEITPFSSSFEYLGWAYPTATPGACY